MSTRKGPVLFEIDESQPGQNPAEAPPVPDTDLPAPKGQAMATAAAIAARKPSKLARWFWRLLGALVGTLVSIAAWRFVTDLVTSTPLLGYAVALLMALFALVVVLIVVKELSAMSRLGRVDRLHRDAAKALADDDLSAARGTVAQLVALYKGRDDTRWGRDRLAERQEDVFDAVALFDLAEQELLSPLDLAARREVEAAARQVATVTALVPLALADVGAALTSNLRMIRRIAEIYGGRSGTLGSWRLTRAVFSHLVATGAVAVGDDMLEPILGGGLLAKLSRRFGEGLVNGALTARVGVAAMEVCRPLPFSRKQRPSVRGIIRTSLSGLFSQEK
ncbi:TIGR01620 family protein [Thalassococcus profundi]|uniref:TIGR01620 family protein n=1 Tax=Thalassococcus profundi TaxID=2282382 RepID=A0A369TMS7_9RHOB|nr:TIGR01620 family protein [Thalassococcus profundi]RDD64246.1 TIGR01620 family protein [Thalassococcus profundi]